MTEEYNTILFSWYFEGFELLRQYLAKHPIGVDLENLGLEKVDKEMAANKVSHSTAPEGDVPEDTSSPSTGDDVAANARTCLLTCFMFAPSFL